MYAVAILISGFLTRHMGSGPFFPYDGFDKGCYKNWWRNLLYLQNLISDGSSVTEVNKKNETNAF
jgi:hypothetical protein